MHVHRDEAAGQPAFGHRRFAGLLHPGVDRELEVVAGHWRLGDQAAVGSRLAEGVNLDPLQSRVPAEVAVVGRLDPVLADFFARLHALVLRLLQLVFVDLADVAEDMGGERSVWVCAHEYPLDRHSREAPLVFLQVVDEVVADVLAQGHGGRRCRLQLFVHRLAHPVQVAMDQARELAQLGAPLGRVGGQLARVDLERQAGAVGDDQLAVAVENLAARGAHPERAGAVVLRFGQVLFAVEHLQQPEPEEQDREEDHGDAAEERDPQCQPIRHRGASLVGSQIHQRRSGGSIRRPPEGVGGWVWLPSRRIDVARALRALSSRDGARAAPAQKSDCISAASRHSSGGQPPPSLDASR